MPLTWLRRPARRRPVARSTNPRRPALAVESLEDRALLSATMIQEIMPLHPNGQVGNLTNVNGTMFFTVDDGAAGTELWRTDGTAVGTAHIHDFVPNSVPGASGPTFLTNVNGTLYFAVNNSPQAGLWKSDGTEAGTVPVEAFKHLDSLTAFNNSLYFSGVGTTGGPALWKSDGTLAGTKAVQNVTIYSPLVTVNGSLFFAGADPAGAHGEELWKSDGTAAGTAMFKEIAPGTTSSVPYDLTAVGNKLFFEVVNPLNQSGLWVSDGTAAGTVRLAQAVPYSAADMVNVNGTLYFLNAGPTNPGLWKSDGTPAGTVLVSPIPNGDDGSVSMTVFQGELYYLRKTSGLSEMWRSDGTAAGTVQISLPSTALAAANLTNVNGTLFFTGRDSAGGFELWHSDGTSDGTVLVQDIAHATAAVQLATVSGVLYFAVGDGQGTELWADNPATGPTAAAGEPYTIYAGESLTLDGLNSTVAIPGPMAFYSWTVNGHAVPAGSGKMGVTGMDGLVTLDRVALAADGVLAPGSYPIQLTVTQGQFSSSSTADLIVSSPLLSVTGVNNTTTEGATFSGVLAKFSNPAGALISTMYNAQVDWGDGSAPSILAVANTLQGLVVSGTHVYAEKGTYKPTVNIEIRGGLPNTVKTTMTVADAPIYAGREFLRTTEGKAWSGTVATITDGNPQGKVGDFTATIQWGDGTTTPGVITRTGPGKFAVQGGHTYAAAATYNVTVSIADVDGAHATAASTFLVDDAALTAVAQKTWAPASPSVSAGVPVVVAGFSDANPLATAAQFSATIDWGDGTTSAGTVAAAKGQPFFVVTGTHAYAKSGSYKVTTTILDAGGSSLKETFTLQAVASGPVSSAQKSGKG